MTMNRLRDLILIVGGMFLIVAGFNVWTVILGIVMTFIGCAILWKEVEAEGDDQGE